MIREELLIHEVGVVAPFTDVDEKDAYGDLVEVSFVGPGAAQAVQIRAWVQQVATSETLSSDGDRTNTNYLLITNTPVGVKDQIIWGPDTFTVEGECAPLHDQRGVHHYETTMKRVTG